jgi:hypothetical protein
MGLHGQAKVAGISSRSSRVEQAGKVLQSFQLQANVLKALIASIEQRKPLCLLPFFPAVTRSRGEETEQCGGQMAAVVWDCCLQQATDSTSNLLMTPCSRPVIQTRRCDVDALGKVSKTAVHLHLLSTSHNLLAQQSLQQ